MEQEIKENILGIIFSVIFGIIYFLVAIVVICFSKEDWIMKVGISLILLTIDVFFWVGVYHCSKEILDNFKRKK